MSKMLENASAPAGLEDMSAELALLNEGTDADVAALYEYLPELGLDSELDFEGLGALGAHKRRKGRKGRRVSKATRRKLRRAAKSRRRRKSGRFAGLEAAKKAAKAASSSKEKGLGASGRKRHRKGGLGVVKKSTLRRRGKRIAKKMKRSKRTGRFVGLKGFGLDGLGSDFSMGLPDYGSEGLGALAGKTRRRGGRKGRKAHRRGRKSGRRMSGLGYLANISDGLGDAEVQASMPGVGVFQWLATGPGLEALGGVALAPVLGAVAAKALNFIPGLAGKMGGTMGQVATSALTAIGMWELGRAVGSAGLAKFGAFYALGRLVETQITNPFLLENAAMKPFKNFGLGTYRESDLAPIGDIVRIPDGQELLGIGDTVRVPDTSTIGHVGDTVRVPDTSTIGEDDDVDGMGQEMIPDTEMEGFGEDEEASVGAEDSDLF